MHLGTFLQDLALIMIVAGFVTILFHQFKQPVVLGYIIAGVILGPHTPTLVFIQDEVTVKTLAELGVIFLMFSLGLEFSIRKLLHVGAAALIAAVAEIIFMVLVGYEIGQFFGWKALDSLFLGAMLAISSTTIIIKAFSELNIKNASFAQIIFGILIIEDILAIGMLALLSSIAVSGSVSVINVISTLGQLLIFLVITFVLGILIVPKLLSYVASFHSKEMLLITVLGLTFGCCLLVMRLDYSVALGAFVIGAIIAESNEVVLIEKLVKPITDMFSAIFFVSIGLLVDPAVIMTYIVPITVITLAVVFGKVLMCSLGVFLSGQNGRTSMRVGMGLAQIGEFSFIIASLGITLNVTSHFLYPIIVAVSAITTLLTPYLIKIADPFANFLAKKVPKKIVFVFDEYTGWIQNIQPKESQLALRQSIKSGLLQIFINLIFIIGIFVAGSYFAHSAKYQFFIADLKIRNTIIWGGSLILSLPFLIAIYRKLKKLSMLLAEFTVKPNISGEYNAHMRRVISEMIPVIALLGISLVLLALSASILPPIELLVLVILIAVIVTVLFWRWFIQLYLRLQTLFVKQFEDTNQKKS